MVQVNPNKNFGYLVLFMLVLMLLTGMLFGIILKKLVITIEAPGKWVVIITKLLARKIKKGVDHSI